MTSDDVVGLVDDLHSFSIDLGPHEGRSLLVLCPAMSRWRDMLTAGAYAVEGIGRS